MRLTKNFTSEEFECNCCKTDGIKKDFVERLQQARTNARISFKITSGYRCPNKQKLLKEHGYETAKGVSPHEKGVAVDILATSGRERHTILSTLMAEKFNRFGIGSNFIHVDADGDRSPNVIWHYKR